MAKKIIYVVVYLRMSDISQDTSIEQQLQQIEAFARREGFQIIKIYKDEGKSGSHSVEKRINFLELLADISSGKFPEVHAICCLDLSRFGRLDSIEGAFAKKILREAGVVLVTVLDGVIDWREQTDRIIDAVLSEAQHDFSFRLSQKTLKGKLKAFQDGTSYGYKLPYGFARLITADDGSTRLVRRREKFTKPKGWSCEVVEGAQDEIEIVEWMFQEFDEKDVGFRWLASELNQKKIPSPTGKKWHSKVVQDLLQNEKYIGDLTLGKSGDGKFWRLSGDEVVRAEGKSGKKKAPLIRKGVLPRIVEVELFDRVQKKIEARRASGSYGGKKGGYILKDILHCGSCGRPLYGNRNTSKPGTVKRKSGKTIYVCKTAIAYGKSCDCGQWSVFESEMLEFLSFYATQLIDPLELGKAMQAKSVPPLQKQVAQIQRALDELAKKIERGAENFLIAPTELTAELSSKLQAWKEERKALENELHESLEVKPELDQIRKLADLRDQLLTLPTTDKELSIRKDSFRRLMRDCAVRVDVWWKRSSENRWEVERIRLQIGKRAIEFSGFAPQFFTLSSLKVSNCALIDRTFSGEEFQKIPQKTVGSEYVSRILGCTPTLVCRLARLGTIPSECILQNSDVAGKWQFDRVLIEGWVAKRLCGKPT